MKRSVVLVSTDRALAASCEQALGHDSLTFACLPTGTGVAEQITEIAPAAVLLDLNTLRFEALSLMRKLRDDGTTILIVEHDMVAIMGLCDNITCMSFGKFLAEGGPKEIRHHPKVIEAYLGGARHVA